MGNTASAKDRHECCQAIKDGNIAKVKELMPKIKPNKALLSNKAWEEINNKEDGNSIPRRLSRAPRTYKLKTIFSLIFQMVASR